MNFKLKNFGKIAEADVKLDGITVICGDNNTGKSTVGKALFSFFNSLNDYKNKIYEQKINKIRKTIRNYSAHLTDSPARILYSDSFSDFISEHYGNFKSEEIEEYLESFCSVKLPKETLSSLVEYLNTPEIDILNEYVCRYITSVMNGQIKNVFASNDSSCCISGNFKHFTNIINVKDQVCTCELNKPIEHSAYYINNPFDLDNLNEPSVFMFKNNIMSRNIVYAILQAQSEIDKGSMTNIIDTVLNKKDLDDVRSVIKKAYSGDTMIDHGRYFYIENDVKFDFRNLSAGLKSFAIIERLIETGVLKKKDVLILDEPEIHLHSEWQIIYAELIVLLQKKFDLTVLIVTHSFQFLESLEFFMKNHGTSDKGNYYIPKVTDKGIVFKSYDNDALELKKALTTGSITLSDLKFEHEMRNYREEDN